MKNVRRAQKSEKFSDTEADKGKKGAGSFPQEFVRTHSVQFRARSGLQSGFSVLYFFF